MAAQQEAVLAILAKEPSHGYELRTRLRHVASGETVAIMGPSGCGKIDLPHLIGGLDRPTGGEIWLAGAGSTR